MASGSSIASPNTAPPCESLKVSDCPQCQSLCVGALLLPCGHLTCRKCLRDHHGSQLTCQICKYTLPFPKKPKSANFSSLVQKLGTDPVVLQLVNQRLRGQSHVRCQVCVNRDATNLCHDCNEQFCDGCANVHRKQGVSNDHLMQTLPQVLQNVSSASGSTFRPRTHSAFYIDSLESISNPMDSPQSHGQSRGSQRWKQWVAEEVKLLQQALSGQDELLRALNDVVSRAQHALSAAQAYQQLLQTYIDVLPLFSVTDYYEVDTRTFNVTLPDDDVNVQVKMDAIQQRIRDVIDRKKSAEVFTDVTSLMRQLKEILRMCEDMTKAGHCSTTQSVTTTMSTATLSSPTVDPMTACPRRVFTLTPACDDDIEKPGISSIISTQDGQRLVMADYNNLKVKLLDMNHPHTVSHSLTMKEIPWRLALLNDGTVAMTTRSLIIYMLNVTNTVTVTSRIKTDIRYTSIAGHSDGTLIVSCKRDDNKGVASIKIIRRNGDVVRTITDSNTLNELVKPWYLCVVKNAVLVSDHDSDTVLTVEVNTGHLVDTLTHDEMICPRLVTTDTSGHVYIASSGGHCVLLKSPGGQWRKLLTYSDHSDQGYDYPVSVCVTGCGRLLVAWWHSSKNKSRVICYDL